MAVREFIGARYITKFANPIEWDVNRAYEAIEAVQYAGFTYISKQPVPVGVDIANDDFWLKWADPNAQMEQLRQLMEQYSNDVDTLSENVTEWDDKLNSQINRIDAIETAVTNGLGKHMVVIGDSYSTDTYNPVSSAWYTIVANRLNKTAHCYARNNAGYVRVGQTNANFLIEAERAVSDTAFDNSEVGLVFVYGGLNDMYVDYISNLRSKAVELFNYLKNNFPNALIIAMGINHWPTGLWVNPDSPGITTINYAYQISSAANEVGIAFIPTWHWLLKSTYYDSSNSHPNTSGNAAEAFNVLNSLCGSPFIHDGYIDGGTVTTDEGVYNCVITCNNSMLEYSGSYRITKENGSSMVITPPMNLYSNALTFRGIPTISDINKTGFLNNNNNGKITANGTNNTVYYYNFCLPIRA